jgi:hypothetical protein
MDRRTIFLSRIDWRITTVSKLANGKGVNAREMVKSPIDRRRHNCTVMISNVDNDEHVD